MPAIHTVADLRARARRRLPRPIFDFIDGGGGEEYSVRRNQEAFAEVRLLTRVLEPCRTRDLSTNFLGTRYAAPFGVSPMGLGNLAWPGTDEALVRATAKAGIPYSLSTAGSTTVERVAELGGHCAWFQLYLPKDFELSTSLLRRADAAGVRTLLFTVDASQPGRRLRDRRSGFGQPLLATPRSILSYALHPGWSLATLAAGIPTMANLATGAGDFEGAQAAQQFMASIMHAKLDWESLDQIRALWPHKLIVKGVLDPLDARRIADAGVDAVMVSNHGGRQLGSAASPLDVLPAIRAEVGPDYPLVLDSGVRSGEDVVKALILGANFVLLGRPWLYATAALGATEGAACVTEMLKSELDNAMSQLGCANIADLTRERLWRG